MEGDAVNQPVAHLQEGLGLLHTRFIAQTQDFRRPFFFPPLLHNQQIVCFWLRDYENWYLPFDVSESLLDRVRQGWIRRPAQIGVRPGNAMIHPERLLISGIEKTDRPCHPK